MAEQLQGKSNAIQFVTEKGILPDYFAGIKEQLQFIAGQIISSALKDAASLKERPHFVGGGTDLYVQKHDEMKDAAIRFLFDHPELNGITKEGNTCLIGHGKRPAKFSCYQ